MKKLFQINKKYLNIDILSKLKPAQNKLFNLSINNLSTLFDEFVKEPAAITNLKNLNSDFNQASKIKNSSFDNSNNSNNNRSNRSKDKFSPANKNIKSKSNKKFEPISTPKDYDENNELNESQFNNTNKSFNNKNFKNKNSNFNKFNKFNNNNKNENNSYSKNDLNKNENINNSNSNSYTYKNTNSKFNFNNKFSKTGKLNIPFAKDGKPISIFSCKSTDHVAGMYYTYKTYFNKDINLLAKVLIRFCQVANYEGMRGVENLAKLRIVKELIKNLSEKIDSDGKEIFENRVVIDIMKILKYNKVVEKVKERSYSIFEDRKKININNNKKFDGLENKENKENKEIEMLIENFIVEKVLKNLNLKAFLKNLENGNQMTEFIENLTMVSKKTELKKNFKFLLFKAEILSNYDRILIGKYQTRNLIELLWAMANAHISLPDAYMNITNEIINRFEYLDFESKIQILFTSALQKNFNKKLVYMIFKDWKTQAKLNNYLKKNKNEEKNKIINDELNNNNNINNQNKNNESQIMEELNDINITNNDFLMHKLLESKLVYFKELLYFWNVWGQQNKKVDAVMSQEIFTSIMKFVYFKFIKRRRNGDDLIFTEFDQNKQTHKAVLLELDRINLFGFLLRYAPDYGKSFDIQYLCFEDLYLLKKKEREEAILLAAENENLKEKKGLKDVDKESAVDGLKMDSDEEEDFVIEEIRKKQDESEKEEIKEIKKEDEKNEISGNKDITAAELNLENLELNKNELKEKNVICDASSNNQIISNNKEKENKQAEEEIKIIDEETKQKIIYYQTVANKDRKYELDIAGVIEEFVNIFGYNLHAYIENYGYNLVSLAFADNSLKMVNLLNKIFKLMNTEHHKISPREYVRICSLIPVFLKIIKFNSHLTIKNSINNHNNDKNNNLICAENPDSNKILLFSLLQRNENNLINFLKGIISENNLSYFLHKNCEIAVIMDINEILDKIRIFDNKIFAKITNLSSEEIKAYLETNKINALNFEQIFCLNYLCATLKISLEKKISEELKKLFIEKFREDPAKNRFKPLKKTLLNSVLFAVDKHLRQIFDEENSGKAETKNLNSDKNVNNINEEKAKSETKNKPEKDFDAELLKILSDEILFENKNKNNIKNQNLNLDLDLDSDLYTKNTVINKMNKNQINNDKNNNNNSLSLNLDLELNEFVQFDSYENLRLPENLGIEDRDIFFSLNAYDNLDTLLSSIKNLKYITNKTFESNYYLDYYLPKLKIGFIVYNAANSLEISENQKVILFEDLPGQKYLTMKPLAFRPLIELFKSKFNVDLFVVNELVLENKSDDLIAIIKKFNAGNN